jgi:hypothetical protein
VRWSGDVGSDGRSGTMPDGMYCGVAYFNFLNTRHAVTSTWN